MTTSNEAVSAAKKVRIQDIKPYDAPAGLDELHGPRSGHVSLPPWVYWGPNPTFDVESAGIVTAYQARIQEGRTVDQVQILNRELLITIWPKLMMPPRVRQLWEGRFPELTATLPPTQQECSNDHGYGR